MALALTNDEEFKALLEDKEHPKLAVMFYADWCGSCKLFKPKYRRMSEEEQYEGIDFLLINAEENQDARKLAGVTNLPFFAMFKEGELVKADFGAKKEFVESMISTIQ